MDIQTISNIVLCILSFILAAVSIITVVITLKQNHQMIENSTRPYVTVYSRITNFQEPFYYLIVKNFGQSKATITSFNCDFDLEKCSFHTEHVPFQHIVGAEIMPGQSYLCTVDRLNLCANAKSLSFDISYTDGNRNYSEHCFINIEADIDLAPTRAAAKGKELRNISYTLQDLVEKIM